MASLAAASAHHPQQVAASAAVVVAKAAAATTTTTTASQQQKNQAAALAALVNAAAASNGGAGAGVGPGNGNTSSFSSSSKVTASTVIAESLLNIGPEVTSALSSTLTSSITNDLKETVHSSKHHSAPPHLSDLHSRGPSLSSSSNQIFTSFAGQSNNSTTDRGTNGTKTVKTEVNTTGNTNETSNNSNSTQNSDDNENDDNTNDINDTNKLNNNRSDNNRTSPNAPSQYVRTRIRTSFDPEMELPKLHKWFSENQHPSRPQILQYVKELNGLESRRGRKPLDVNNVVYWFKNARAAHKRNELKLVNGSQSPTSSNNNGKDCVASNSNNIINRLSSGHFRDPFENRLGLGSRLTHGLIPGYLGSAAGLTASHRDRNIENESFGDSNENEDLTGHVYEDDGSDNGDYENDDMIMDDDCLSQISQILDLSVRPVKLERSDSSLPGSPVSGPSSLCDLIRGTPPHILSSTSSSHFNFNLKDEPLTDDEDEDAYDDLDERDYFTLSQHGLNLHQLSTGMSGSSIGRPDSPEEGPRIRRSRTFIDPTSEVPKLEQWFSQCTHPNQLQIVQFTEELNSSSYRLKYPRLEPKNIQFWFKNRRAKSKRKSFPAPSSNNKSPSAPAAEKAIPSVSTAPSSSNSTTGLTSSSTTKPPSTMLAPTLTSSSSNNNNTTTSSSAKTNNNHNNSSLSPSSSRSPSIASNEEEEEDDFEDLEDSDYPTLPRTLLNHPDRLTSDAHKMTATNLNEMADLSVTTSAGASSSNPVNQHSHGRNYSNSSSYNGSSSGPGIRPESPCEEGGKIRRSRTFIDPTSEVPKLEQWFSQCTHPSHQQIVQFTEELNSSSYRLKYPKLGPKNIQFWFKNRRAKSKRQNVPTSSSNTSPKAQTTETLAPTNNPSSTATTTTTTTTNHN